MGGRKKGRVGDRISLSEQERAINDEVNVY